MGNAANIGSTADQLITLTGGTIFIVIDVVVTNASTSLTTADDFQIWNGTSRSGIEITHDIGSLSSLTASTRYINIGNGLTIGNRDTLSTFLYASVGTPQMFATLDIYVYGYILL